MSCSLTANDQTRRRWVREQLKRLPSGTSILDAGCGEQPFRGDCAHLHYVAQDFGGYRADQSPEATAKETVYAQQQNPDFQYGHLDIQSDIWNIPLEDASFDAVLCTEVLEHIPCPNETIRELSRLLVPGGRLILTAPVCSMPHFNPFYFYNGFSREFYEHNASVNGMVIEEITTNGNEYLFVLQELLRLHKETRTLIGKLFFGVCVLPAAAWLTIAGKRRKQSKYLSFGYHVVMRKAQQRDKLAGLNGGTTHDIRKSEATIADH